MPPRKGETPAAWAEETSSRGKSSSRLRRGDAQGARAEEGTLGDQGHDAAGEVDRHGVAADGAGRLGEGGLGGAVGEAEGAAVVLFEVEAVVAEDGADEVAEGLAGRERVGVGAAGAVEDGAVGDAGVGAGDAGGDEEGGLVGGEVGPLALATEAAEVALELDTHGGDSWGGTMRRGYGGGMGCGEGSWGGRGKEEGDGA